MVPVRDEEVPRLDPFTFTENVFVSFYIELYIVLSMQHVFLIGSLPRALFL